MTNTREENAADMAREKKAKAETIDKIHTCLCQHDDIMGLEPTAEPETRVWHMLYSMIEYCDHHKIDIDNVLEQVRDGYDNKG